MKRNKYLVRSGEEETGFQTKPPAIAKMAEYHRANKPYSLWRCHAPDGKNAPPVNTQVESWFPA